MADKLKDINSILGDFANQVTDNPDYVDMRTTARALEAMCQQSFDLGVEKGFATMWDMVIPHLRPYLTKEQFTELLEKVGPHE